MIVFEAGGNQELMSFFFKLAFLVLDPMEGYSRQISFLSQVKSNHNKSKILEKRKIKNDTKIFFCQYPHKKVVKNSIARH